MGDKEAVAIVIDAAELPLAVPAMLGLVNTKVLFASRDAVGIILHGTAETANTLATEHGDGTYEHITELHKMAPVSFRTIAAIDNASKHEASADSADLIDSLCLGMYAVIQFVKKLKYKKRVLCITNGTSPATVEDEQLGEIAAQVALACLHGPTIVRPHLWRTAHRRAQRAHTAVPAAHAAVGHGLRWLSPCASLPSRRACTHLSPPHPTAAPPAAANRRRQPRGAVARVRHPVRGLWRGH